MARGRRWSAFSTEYQSAERKVVAMLSISRRVIPVHIVLATVLLSCSIVNAQEAWSLRAGASRSQCSQISQTFGPVLDPGTAREINQLAHYFSVSPGFFACYETGGPNAFATMDTLQPGTAGSVLIGVGLVQ